MKKKIFIICALMFVLLFMGGVTMLIRGRSGTVGTFDIAAYGRYIDEFPSEKILGEISDEKSAKESAQTLFCEIYGESVKSQRPFTVAFDEKNQVWLIQGTLSENYDGGSPHALIKKSDGKVLAVWHDK